MSKDPYDRPVWPFSGEEPQWYRDQAPGWNALSDAGWKFSRPPCFADAVCLEMSIEDYSVTFKVPRRWGMEKIHTRLLALCKAAANIFYTT